MEELRPGLWRWVSAHPGWKPENDTPSGWKQDVASIAVEAADGRLVLIDPLVRGESVWRWLDGRGPIVIVLGNGYHTRSTDEIVARTGATVLGPSDAPPPGIEVIPIAGLDANETAYAVPTQRAIVFADAVIGSGGGAVRVAPPSWSADKELYARVFRAELAKIAERPLDLVLTSHGAPVLAAGGAALRQALAGPAWGE